MKDGSFETPGGEQYPSAARWIMGAVLGLGLGRQMSDASVDFTLRRLKGILEFLERAGGMERSQWPRDLRLEETRLLGSSLDAFLVYLILDKEELCQFALGEISLTPKGEELLGILGEVLA